MNAFFSGDGVCILGNQKDSFLKELKCQNFIKDYKKDIKSLCYSNWKDNFLSYYIKSWCSLKRGNDKIAKSLILSQIELTIDDFLLSKKYFLSNNLIIEIFNDFKKSGIDPLLLLMLKDFFSNFEIKLDFNRSKNIVINQIINNPLIRLRAFHLYADLILKEKGYRKFIYYMKERELWNKKNGIGIWSILNDKFERFKEKDQRFLLEIFKTQSLNIALIQYSSPGLLREELEKRSPLEWNFNSKRRNLQTLLEYPRMESWAKVNLHLIENY